MDVAAWQKRLESTFLEEGIVGGGLLPVRDAEREYCQFIVRKCRGYLVLTGSFLSFFLQTLRMADRHLVERVTNPKGTLYSLLLLAQTTNFQTCRAAQILLLRGYPLVGYSLLRDLKDRVVILGAVAGGLAAWKNLHPLAADVKERVNDLEYFTRLKRQRQKKERHALNQMLRSQSGLDEAHRKELRYWEELFHLEVHGSRFTFAVRGGKWLLGDAVLPALPDMDIESAVVYTNQAVTVDWMLLRTLPFLQLWPNAFGQTWAQKWDVLDDSFRFHNDQMQEAGVGFASAVRHLIEKKFAFSPGKTHYAERPHSNPPGTARGGPK